MKQILKMAIVGAMLGSASGMLSAYEGSSDGDATAEQQAGADFNVQMAVAKASKAWKDAFNAGDAAGAAALYEDDAVMVVKPFGTFTGKDQILAFWTDLVSKGFDNVVYKNSTMVVLDAKSARVSAEWKMNKAHGIITNEHWVVQPDGRALLREDHFEVAQ
ncbi:MAG: nuclear transport factor 2 family protein [Kordiimonas sp.]